MQGRKFQERRVSIAVATDICVAVEEYSEAGKDKRNDRNFG